jgi:Protein of unknown function (DUF4238)
MTRQKMHHFVPKMLLKHFSNESGKLWFFRKDSKMQVPALTSYEDVFSEGQLYAFQEDNGSENLTAETKLSEIESSIASIIKCLVRWDRKSPLPLDVNQVHQINSFIVQMFKRNPSTLRQFVTTESVKSSFQKTKEEVRGEGQIISEEFERRLLAPDEIAKAVGETQVTSVLITGDELQAVLRDRGIFLAYSEKEEFLIGSNPVLRRKGLKHDGLTDPSAEFWLPISPKLCVSPFGKLGSVTILKANDRFAKQLNDQCWLQSGAVVARSKSTIESHCVQPN